MHVFVPLFMTLGDQSRVSCVRVWPQGTSVSFIVGLLNNNRNLNVYFAEH